MGDLFVASTKFMFMNLKLNTRVAAVSAGNIAAANRTENFPALADILTARLGMKYLVTGAIGLCAVGIAGAASAADVPARTYTKAPAYVAAVHDWTGFYVGANGGWGGFVGAGGSSLGLLAFWKCNPKKTASRLRRCVAKRAASGLELQIVGLAALGPPRESFLKNRLLVLRL
jgi:hypothetical protein